MTTLEFKWTTSRARDSYGYPVCTLYADGSKVARCNGGGYDMIGTNLGTYVARAYADRLLALKADDMEAMSHWEPAEKPRRLCENMKCRVEHHDDIYLASDALTCPHCGSDTFRDPHDGKRVDDGRYFYGLTYHDPNYDPGKAVIGGDVVDRTFGDSAGTTVEAAEAAGKSLGLERYAAVYAASSKVPTERHTVPSIDGGCGKSAVERIMKAIGLGLRFIPTKGVYELIDEREKAVAA